MFHPNKITKNTLLVLSQPARTSPSTFPFIFECEPATYHSWTANLLAKGEHSEE